MPIMPKRPRSGDSALHSINASSSENKSSKWSFGRLGRMGSGSNANGAGRSASSSCSPIQSKKSHAPLSASSVTATPDSQGHFTAIGQSHSSISSPTQPLVGYQIEDPSLSPFIHGQYQVPSVKGSNYLGEYADMQNGQANMMHTSSNGMHHEHYTTSSPNSMKVHHSLLQSTPAHPTDNIGSGFLQSLPHIHTHSYNPTVTPQQPLEAHSMYSEASSSPSQITVCESDPATPSVMASYSDFASNRSTSENQNDWMKYAQTQKLTSGVEGAQVFSTSARQTARPQRPVDGQMARLPLIDHDVLYDFIHDAQAPDPNSWAHATQTRHPTYASPMYNNTPPSSDSNATTSHESDRFYRNGGRQSSNSSQPSHVASTHTSYSSDSIAAEEELFTEKAAIAEMDRNAAHASSSQVERRQYSSIFQPQPLHALNEYEPLETLGTGTFGRVLLVRLRSGSRQDPKNYFALKVLNKMDVIRLKQVTHTNNERDILSKVHHPFIVNLYCTYQDEKNCYMLMEYVMGGEVFSHLRKARRFTVDVTRFYISTLVLALAHLHSEKILYRDLKPENLLLDRQGYIKIADFGFAKSLRKSGRTWTLCGTPEYLSPEVIQSQGQSFASDYWALGILMYEMLCGFPPFFDKTPFGTYEKILQANIVFPKHVDACSRDLIQALLTRDVTKRLGNLSGGANDVIRHPWFEGVDWHALLNKTIPAPIIPVQSHAGDSANFQKYDAFDITKMPALQQQRQSPVTNTRSTTKNRSIPSSQEFIQCQFPEF